MTKRYTELKNLKPFNFVFLTLAGVINAFGVTLFLFPMKLYDSGVSGLSMLLDQITPGWLTLPIFLIVINLPIFLFGMRKQGLSFTVYSMYAVLIYSGMSFLITDVLPIDVTFASPLAGEDLLLCAIFGGAVSGIGSGLTIRFGGAIDGIDVLSVIFAKRIGISLGTFVMAFNAVLYITCGIIMQSWILPLYSVVTYFIGFKTVDYIVEGFDRSKCAMIVTVKADDITKAMQEVFKSTGTVVNAIGGYSREEKQIIYFIVNAFQIYKVRQLVHEIDPGAFISLHDVSDVIRKSADAGQTKPSQEERKDKN